MAEDDEQVCRYCLGDDSEENLVRACACRGSAALVHSSCLIAYAEEQQKLHLPVLIECPTCRTPFIGPAAVELLKLLQEQIGVTDGQNHKLVAETHVAMAQQLMVSFKFKEALSHAERAVEMLENLQSKQLPFEVAGGPLDMAEALAILALVQSMSGEDGSAEVAASALDLLDEHYGGQCGADSVRVAMALGVLSLSQKSKRQASLAARVWSLLEEFFGEEDMLEVVTSNTAMSTILLVKVHCDVEMGKYEAAIVFNERMSRALRQKFGCRHIVTISATKLYAQTLSLVGKHHEAQQLIRDMLSAAGTMGAEEWLLSLRACKAQLLGEEGQIEGMHSELLSIQSCGMNSLLRAEVLRQLRVSEAVRENKKEVQQLFVEAKALEASAEWEEIFLDAQVLHVCEEHQEAEMLLTDALQQLDEKWGCQGGPVLQTQIARAQQFWCRNLSGARKDAMQDWLAKVRSTCCKQQESKGVTLDCKPIARGDEVQSLVCIQTGAQTWAVREGDAGKVTEKPKHGHAVIDFGNAEPHFATLSLSDICHREEFDSCIAKRRREWHGYKVGQHVRSLVAMRSSFPRPLGVGDVGVITAIDRAHGQANVDFGGAEPLQHSLALGSECAMADFDDRVRSLRNDSALSG